MKKLLFLILNSQFLILNFFAQTVTHGPVIGAATDSSARIYIRTDQMAQITIELDSDSTFSNPTSFSDSTRIDKDNSVIIAVSGLSASTNYYYRVLVNQAQATNGNFKTFPTEGQIADFTFTFGSCHGTGGNMTTLFTTMENQNPDLFLQLGDFGYPDGEYGLDFPHVDCTLIGSYHDKYGYMGIGDLLRNTPIDYVYDDHDYVDNNASRDTRAIDSTYYDTAGVIQTALIDFPLHPDARKSAIEGYLDYFPGYPMIDTTEGLFHSFRYGNTEFFFLDNRSARSPNYESFVYDSSDINSPWEFDPPTGHSILGQPQMDWLQTQLLNSTATWKFIVSGTTFNKALKNILLLGFGLQKYPLTIGGVSGTGIDLASGFADGWVGFPEDQNGLVDFVKTNNVKNVVILTGDTHTSAMDDGTNSGLPEFNSSDLNVSSSSIQLYYLVDSIGQQMLGQPAVLDSMWNKGAAGVGNNNFNPGFGRIQVFGDDSIRMCQVDLNGQEVHCWTMPEGFIATGEPYDDFIDSRFLKIYPNPAKEVLTIEVDQSVELSSNNQLFIFDSAGRLIVNEQKDAKSKFSVDVSKFASGVYILSFRIKDRAMNKIFTVAK